MPIDRRLFLISAAATVPLYAGPLITFSENEGKLVAAITDHIIPADDTPGALEAGVVFFIDKQLAGPLKRFRDAYRTGIPKLESTCQTQTGKRFLDLSRTDQLTFLTRVESTPFFAMMVDHTMQGFYGSPEHGGNKGEASWKMLGIESVMTGHKH